MCLAQENVLTSFIIDAFEDRIDLKNSGIYFNSKFRNMEAGKFSRTNRPGLEDKNKVPGPGSYGNFTEFAFLNKSSMQSPRASTSGKY